MDKVWNLKNQSSSINFVQKPKAYEYKGFFDIIIPVFNDRDGLMQTLCSINVLHQYSIIIVDDCSTECTYDDIVSFFKQWHRIQYVRTPRRTARGCASIRRAVWPFWKRTA